VAGWPADGLDPVQNAEGEVLLVHRIRRTRVADGRHRGLEGRRQRGIAARGQCRVRGVSERSIGGKKKRTGTLISSGIASKFAERFTQAPRE